MTGIIDNPEFGVLFKKVLVRTLAMKLMHFINLPGVKLYKVLKSDPSQREIDLVSKFSDDSWLAHIGLDKSRFRITNEPIPKVIT